MNISRMEEQLFESEVADLRLTTLEALAREQCLQNARMDARLRELEERTPSLQPQLLSEVGPKKSGHGEGEGDDVACSAAHADELTSPLSTSPTEDPSTPMCDYCFRFSHACFPCPRCDREWYCSAACQRLRHRSHASRCGQWRPNQLLAPQDAPTL